MNKKLADLIYLLLIAVVIASCIYLVFFLKSSGKECLSNPVIFFEQKNDASCFCLTKTGQKFALHPEDPTIVYNENVSPVNFSGFNGAIVK